MFIIYAEIGAFLLYTLKVSFWAIYLDPDDTSKTNMVQVTGSSDRLNGYTI